MQSQQSASRAALRVLHGVEDFAIVRGGTLERPAFAERDRLRKILFKYKLHQGQELFIKAYGYIKQYC